MIRCRHPIAIASMLALAALSGGCHGLTDTVVPPAVAAHEIAWSGNDQNAGILGYDDKPGVHINADFRARYNLAISIYGRRTPRPLAADDGLTADPDGTYHIDEQHFQFWALMCSWRRGARPP